jgi:hypothetical protein
MTVKSEFVTSKKAFTQWVSKHPEMKPIKYQFYILFLLIITKFLWAKHVDKVAMDYAADAISIYGIFLLLWLYKKKKSLRQKYHEAVDEGESSSSEAGNLPSRVPQGFLNFPAIAKFALPALGVALAGVFLLRSGQGLDATLDASKGYDVNYHASLAKAFEKMSESQKNTYNWVVSELSEGTFISLYGKHPTVREVINGQLDIWEENNKKALAEQKLVVSSKSEEISARDALKERAKKLLGTIAASAKITTKIEGSSCQGVVCDKDEATLISYKVDNPNNLQLSEMPCKAKVTPKDSVMYYTYKLDGCEKQGNFETKIIIPKGVSFDGATLEVLFVDDEAMVSYGTPAIPKDIPEVVRLKELEEANKNIADGRDSLKG